MIISHGRKYIFVHIPKTGGTALSLALEERAMADDILVGDTPKAVKRRHKMKKSKLTQGLHKHARLADVEGVVAREVLDDYFTFTLVRNPWDRIVSYYHWLKLQGWDHPAVHLAKAVDFTTFLNDRSTLKSFSLPYAHYLQDSRGIEHNGHYARLEALDQDLMPLWDHLGFNLSPITRTNASPRARDFREYYTDADQAVVAKLCKADIERFGYGFTQTGLCMER
ncbi:MAG: hypothetical protein ACJAR9_001794 [Celeribacter sp.]|jgi:hypothetical protein